MQNSGRVSVSTILASTDQYAAEEWKKWLLVYSPALLCGYLPNDAFQFYIALVTAIQILMAPFTEELLHKGQCKVYMCQQLISFVSQS